MWYEVETAKGEKVGMARGLEAAERMAEQKAREFNEDMVVKAHCDDLVLVEFGKPRK